MWPLAAHFASAMATTKSGLAQRPQPRRLSSDFTPRSTNPCYVLNGKSKQRRSKNRRLGYSGPQMVAKLGMLLLAACEDITPRSTSPLSPLGMYYCACSLTTDFSRLPPTPCLSRFPCDLQPPLFSIRVMAVG